MPVQIVQGRVFRSWVKITQAVCEIWTQIWEIKKRSKFSLTLFAYNLMIGYSKKNRENYPERVLLIKRKKKPGLKFNPGWALIGLQTTGPRTPLNLITIINQFKRRGTSRVGYCQKTMLIKNLWKKDFVKKSLRLPSVSFPWSLAVHHQSLSITMRKTPEEEAGFK